MKSLFVRMRVCTHIRTPAPARTRGDFTQPRLRATREAVRLKGGRWATVMGALPGASCAESGEAPWPPILPGPPWEPPALGAQPGLLGSLQTHGGGGGDSRPCPDPLPPQLEHSLKPQHGSGWPCSVLPWRPAEVGDDVPHMRSGVHSRWGGSVPHTHVLTALTRVHTSLTQMSGCAQASRHDFQLTQFAGKTRDGETVCSDSMGT